MPLPLLRGELSCEEALRPPANESGGAHQSALGLQGKTVGGLPCSSSLEADAFGHAPALQRRRVTRYHSSSSANARVGERSPVFTGVGVKIGVNTNRSNFAKMYFRGSRQREEMATRHSSCWM